MTNFASVGSDKEGVNIIPLDVWKGPGVESKSYEPIFLKSNTSIPQHYIGLTDHPKCFLSRINNTGSQWMIREVTLKDNVPSPLPVVLMTHEGILVSQTVSQENGVVEFKNLQPGQSYILVAIDPEGMYNAGALDYKIPVIDS